MESIQLIEQINESFPESMEFSGEHITSKKLEEFQLKYKINFDNDLISVLLNSNGLRIMDYFLLGLEYEFGTDMNEANEIVWMNIPTLENKFFCFMITSGGEYYGLVKSQKSETMSIAYIEDLMMDTYTIVCDSFSKFFISFLSEVLKTLNIDSEADYILAFPQSLLCAKAIAMQRDSYVPSESPECASHSNAKGL